MIRENLQAVEEKIEKACQRAGRDRKNVTLIAVSKTKPVPALLEAYEAGAREFGENKVQEMVDKYGQLPQDIHWHLIGHLQRNKVKYIVDKASLIHSVDSYRLAQEISREAVKRGVSVPILIQVNVAQEETKFGFSCQEAPEEIKKMADLPNISIKGLMTIAPYVEDPEGNRPVFRKLKKLSVDIACKNIDNVYMDELSMGMTGDYEVAVEEGATYIRIGTGIFGARQYDIIDKGD